MEDIRHIIPFFVPIIAIILGIAIGMLGLILDYRKKSRMFELHHQERLLAIERGMEVPPLPPEFFFNPRRDGARVPARAACVGVLSGCCWVRPWVWPWG
jgi:hypothetical protein